MRQRQQMYWHSLHQSKTSDDIIIMETAVFHCGQCDRYLAHPLTDDVTTASAA